VENAISPISSVQCTPVGMYQKNFGKRLALNFSDGAFCLAKLELVFITYFLGVVAHVQNFIRLQTYRTEPLWPDDLYLTVTLSLVIRQTRSGLINGTIIVLHSPQYNYL